MKSFKVEAIRSFVLFMALTVCQTQKTTFKNIKTLNKIFVYI